MLGSKSKNKWLKEHFDDPYVKQSRKDGLRSRAAYKLVEINARYKILKPDINVIDLGAAPGGWLQVVADKCSRSKIFALDILPI